MVKFNWRETSYNTGRLDIQETIAVTGSYGDAQDKRAGKHHTQLINKRTEQGRSWKFVPGGIGKG